MSRRATGLSWPVRAIAANTCCSFALARSHRARNRPPTGRRGYRGRHHMLHRQDRPRLGPTRCLPHVVTHQLHDVRVPSRIQHCGLQSLRIPRHTPLRHKIRQCQPSTVCRQRRHLVHVRTFQERRRLGYPRQARRQPGCEHRKRLISSLRLQLLPRPAHHAKAHHVNVLDLVDQHHHARPALPERRGHERQ